MLYWADAGASSTAGPTQTNSKSRDLTDGSTQLVQSTPPGLKNNICWRTPEVQDRIIQDLSIPSCQIINESELLVVSQFERRPAWHPLSLVSMVDVYTPLI